MKTQITRGLAALGLAVTVAACSDALSLDAAGDVAMTIQRAGDGSLFGPSPSSSDANSTAMSADTVEAFLVTVTSVQFQHAPGDSNAGEWSTVQLSHPVTIDLMAIGSSDSSAYAFASGRVEAGSYSRIRLLIASPKITFKGDISFGLGQTLQGGVQYDVSMPGGQTGIEATVDVEVAVNSSSEAHLVFDQVASLLNVSLSGSGLVQLTPVIRER